MCLILVAWQAHPHYPLVIAANRDEFYARPSARARFWADAPDLLAGRDLEAGGTWLGVTRTQRFSALTNFREGGRPRPDAPSRGALVSGFLTGDSDPGFYLDSLAHHAAMYNGFNLFVGDGQRLGYYSNRETRGPRWLAPGVYGLSNHLLDTPWPKLAAAKKAFSAALKQLPTTAPFFELLTDREIVPDTHLPETGVPIEWERILSAIFVCSPDYGTRASTVLTMHRDGRVMLAERSYGKDALPLGEAVETFQGQPLSPR
jgi:uncharacterized protein with NRDE domain